MERITTSWLFRLITYWTFYDFMAHWRGRYWWCCCHWNCFYTQCGYCTSSRRISKFCTSSIEIIDVEELQIHFKLCWKLSDSRAEHAIVYVEMRKPIERVSIHSRVYHFPSQQQQKQLICENKLRKKNNRNWVELVRNSFQVFILIPMKIISVILAISESLTSGKVRWVCENVGRRLAITAKALTGFGVWINSIVQSSRVLRIWSCFLYLFASSLSFIFPFNVFFSQVDISHDNSRYLSQFSRWNVKRYMLHFSCQNLGQIIK